MALRAYSSDTLNGNWAEERSQPLRGVLSDLGHREYDTTHRTAFRRPSSSGPSDKCFRSNTTWPPQETEKTSRDSIKKRVGHDASTFTRQERLKDGKYPTKIAKGRGRSVEDCDLHALSSRTRLAGPATMPKEPETTMRAAFGVPERVCKTAERALRAPDALPSGRGSKEAGRRERNGGTKLSKPVGELFMEGEDPSHSTPAQRSWVCTQDAVVMYHEQRVPAALPAEGLSIDVGEGPGATSVNKKRSRTITREREPNTQKGTSVWSDFHIAPGEA